MKKIPMSTHLLLFIWDLWSAKHPINSRVFLAFEAHKFSHDLLKPNKSRSGREGEESDDAACVSRGEKTEFHIHLSSIQFPRPNELLAQCGAVNFKGRYSDWIFDFVLSTRDSCKPLRQDVLHIQQRLSTSKRALNAVSFQEVTLTAATWTWTECRIAWCRSTVEQVRTIRSLSLRLIKWPRKRQPISNEWPAGFIHLWIGFIFEQLHFDSCPIRYKINS